MTPDERLAVVDHLQAIEAELRDVKGAAYAGTVDTLANFKRNGERWGMTKYQTWGVYFGKHLDSVQSAIAANPERPVDPSEGLAGRITDLRVYLELLACLLVEDGLMEGAPGAEEPGERPRDVSG